MAETSQPFNSPEITETMNRPILPISICAPVFIKDDFGRSADLLYMEPIAQNKHAESNAVTPKGFNFVVLPEISEGPTRIKIPTKPISSPTIPCQFGFTPFGRIASPITKNIGTEAMMSAAIPDGMNCSAQATSPFPPNRRSMPMIAVALHCLRVGIGCPAARCQIIRMSPEMRNRTPA